MSSEPSPRVARMSSETQSNQPVQWTIAHEAFEDIRYEKLSLIHI